MRVIVAGKSFLQSSDSKTVEAPPIGAGTVVFGDGQVTENRFYVRAFIPTGSLNTHCLATLSDSNFAVPGMSVFCSPRVFEGEPGLLFSVFFPQQIPEGFTLSATIYQERARGCTPAFYSGTD